MSEVLKPCPFCGTQAEFEPEHDFGDGTKSQAHVHCETCGASIWMRDNDECRIAWNTRTPDAGPQDVREAFERWCLEIRADINLLDAYNSTARQAFEGGYQAASAETQRLRKENERLKDLNAMLKAENISYRQRNALAAADKIAKE